MFNFYHKSVGTVATLPKVWVHDGIRTTGLNAENCESLGWTVAVVPDPEPHTPDYTNLDMACSLFRAICVEVEAALNIENFRGGFNELLALTQEQHDIIRGMGLTDRLNLADRLCNHEANKVGMEAPAWWYRCWETSSTNPD